jgi:hypothetical protein
MEHPDTTSSIEGGTEPEVKKVDKSLIYSMQKKIESNKVKNVYSTVSEQQFPSSSAL